MLREKPTIAIALESELHVRGGVNVLVETIIDEIADSFRIILVSTDPLGTDLKAMHPRIDGHVHWSSHPTSRAGALQLARELAELKVQLVHFHSGVFGFGMRFFGHCPIRPLAKLGIVSIWTNHTWVSLMEGFCGPQKPLWFKLGFLPFAWFSRCLELCALKVLIGVSALACRRERQFYFPVRNKVRLVYHSRSRESTAVSEFGLREKTVVSVGHLAPRKGQLILVKAFQRIARQFPDWRLKVIGPPVDATYGEEVLRTAQHPDSNGQIDILGSRNDALQFTRVAGVFVQPSFWEGLPIALQEAMFLATPSIATRCNGNDELVINSVNGILTEAGDVAGMACALETLLADSDLRRKYGAEARRTVLEKEMTIEGMAKNHREIYAPLISPL